MSVPDRSIDPRLVTAAKEEFLKHGFEKASLSDICKAAGVTTGALYKRYKGKEELFSYIVSDTVKKMEDFISEIAKSDITSLTDEELYDSFSLMPEANRRWLRFLYENREGFTLLIKCAQGTRYENFHQDWTEKMNALDYKYYEEARRRGMTRRDIEADELHVLTYSIWSLYYEPFYLGFTWEKLEEHAEIMHSFVDFCSALGMKRP